MLRRILPVAVLLVGLVLFWALGLSRYCSFDTLSQHHAELTAWVAAHGVLAALAFVLSYALVGFLFGPWLGAALAVIGATLGAVTVFLAARTALRDVFRARAGKTLAKLEDGFKRDAFNYLLFLRLVPVFPFWLVNIVPALLGMRLGAYALATLIGIIPGAVVYASIGAGFGMLFERGEMPNLGVIFEWRILLPLLGLAALSLVPIIYTRLKGPQRGGTA